MWGVNFGATRRILLNNPWVVAIMRLPIATDIARSVVSVYVSYVCSDHDREPYKTDESMGICCLGTGSCLAQGTICQTMAVHCGENK